MAPIWLFLGLWNFALQWTYSPSGKVPYTICSDINICLVAGERSIKEIFNMFLAEPVTEKYDIKIFETLPLCLKAEVLENAVIIWMDDEFKLSYYLYKWRYDRRPVNCQAEVDR